jgi:DNA-binding phage protein
MCRVQIVSPEEMRKNLPKKPKKNNKIVVMADENDIRALIDGMAKVGETNASRLYTATTTPKQIGNLRRETMKTNTKPITQIAKEIGVTRQAVYQKIRKKSLSTALQGHLTTTVNGLHVDSDGVKLIKSAFLKHKVSTTLQKPFTTTVNGLHPDVDSKNSIESAFSENDLSTVSSKSVDSPVNLLTTSLQGQISMLAEINTKKDEQIKILLEELTKERQHSRNQSDKITELASTVAELAKNAQTVHAMQNAVLLTSGKDEESKQTQKRKGFLNKLFSRGG